MSRALLYTAVTLALGLMGLLAAAQIELIPFKPGDLIVADQVNQNFQTLAEAIEAGALPQDCKAGEVPEWHGTGWSCGQDDVGAGGGGIPASDASVATDILLTGNSCFPCGPEDDDGVIRSDPSLSSSDIFMYSNDAFTVRLDTNGGDNGVFQVQSGDGAAVFQVSENGDVHVNGNIVHSSDRDVKASLGAVDAREVLDGLANLEISRWSFLADESGTPHVGPMAQDFNAAFGLGADERYISATDADGVTMAAIKGLYELVLEQQARIDALEAEVMAARGE